jgi:hypothetical protein
MFLLPHCLVEVSQHQPRPVRTIPHFPQLSPHMMMVTRLWFTIQKSSPPHAIIWPSANVNINMIFAKRKKVNINVFYPVKSQTTTFSFSIHNKAFFHAKAKTQIFHPLFTLPSLTDKN